MEEADSHVQKLAPSGEVGGEFISIPLETLFLDTVTGFKIYVPGKSGAQPVLYRAENFQFTEEIRRRLLEHHVERVYIETSDQDAYAKYIEDNLDKIVADDTIESKKKAEIVYRSVTYLIERLLDNPWMRDGIRRSEELVRNTVDLVLQDEAAFRNFLKVRSYDYYLYAHSVNVCVFSVALAQRMELCKPSDLIVLGTGALLHDIGMSRVDKSITLKRGPLNQEEWGIVKKHPAYGVEILQEVGGVPEESYVVVSQHHERCDKSGYPQGLPAEKIHPYAKVSAIADVFDAMTSQRVYRDAVGTFTAFLSMKNEMRSGLDQTAFHEFVQLMAE